VTPILTLEMVEVRIGNVPVLSSASCSVESGQCLGIQGPNGSGKTTLLRVMATLLKPSSGHGSILGAALDTSGFELVRPRIGLSGHLPALSEHLTLRENLDFVARITGRSDTDVGEVLETVGLARAADRLALDCSHGMRKRADLARLFLTRPDLLLLDEPHAGLDSSATPLVAALVRHTTKKGGGAVIVSHDPTTMVDLADQHMSLRTGILTK
jgi:heme exporter protein A